MFQKGPTWPTRGGGYELSSAKTLSDVRVTAPVSRTVVFDLDHTLIRFDSFAWFNLYLLWRWWRMSLALLMSPVVALLWISTRTRLYAVSMLVWCGTVGMDEQELLRRMDGYIAKVFDDPRAGAWACQGAIAALHRHQREGARIVVATGSVAQLAERVCLKMGIVGVEVVGSTLQRWRYGWIADRHCFGLSKVSMLRERGLDQWDVVYTDSAADLPLLTRGTRRYVVNPTAHNRKKILAHLGADLEVVEWL
jgi:phosphoserine phosphatase